ncbi:MAG: DUF4332 domain-containing protein [Bacteroidota bacterium]
MTYLRSIERIGKVYRMKLSEYGIRTVEDLLDQCADPTQRKQFSERTAISEEKLLDWVHKADLFRLKGLSSQYTELLDAAGVKSMVHLAQADPGKLVEKMRSANFELKLVRQIPGPKQVAQFVEQAQQTTPMVKE